MKLYFQVCDRTKHSKNATSYISCPGQHIHCGTRVTRDRSEMANTTISSSRYVAHYTIDSVSPLSVASRPSSRLLSRVEWIMISPRENQEMVQELLNTEYFFCSQQLRAQQQQQQQQPQGRGSRSSHSSSSSSIVWYTARRVSLS